MYYTEAKWNCTWALSLLFCFLFVSPVALTAAEAQAARSGDSGPTVGHHLVFDGTFAPSESWVKAPEKPYRDEICLNGSWQFQPMPLPSGFREGVDPAPELPLPDAHRWEATPIRIPSPWNVNSFADRNGQGGDFRTYPSYPVAWESARMGWLRRDVNVPATWKGRRIVLHFAAAAGDLQIYVNGRLMGKQFDIFFPFDLDVTDAVRFGQQNEVLVGVRKPSLFDVRGKYGRRPYQGGSFWGQHIVGIWQDISLVALPTVRVSDVYIRPQVDKDLLEIEVTVRNDGSTDANTSISGIIRPWISQAETAGEQGPELKWSLGETALTMPSSSLLIPAHSERTVVLKRAVGNALQTWSPSHPALYGAVVQVKIPGRTMDSRFTRFGWRQISLRGSEVLLNGTPIDVKSDSWHFMGIPQMTRRYAQSWFRALQAAHMNAVRLHAQPYPEFYLDVADEMGILVLDESAIWASDGGPKMDSDAWWKDTENHVEQLVRRDRNHPSVFGWSVCNEVRPVVRNVFKAPREMEEQLTRYYTIWAEICRRLDPTRGWISADGDEDGNGTLPVFVIHYGGQGDYKKAIATGKPWGVGEAGGAYYATPEQVAATYGEKAYTSFLSRMEGIALGSYQTLVDQATYGAKYRSIFNLVWYGLQPLPLGLKDTSRPPNADDGVFFAKYVEGQPGVQPERLGPYTTTLNPGYDSSLPEYRTWPLYDAFRAANAEPAEKSAWSAFTYKKSAAVEVASVAGIAVWDNGAGALRKQLANSGAVLDRGESGKNPALVFVDGKNPPAGNARKAIEGVLADGGTVVVWGVNKESLSSLNALLPARLEVTERKASSLVLPTSSPITSGLNPSDLYFSESAQPIVLDAGLAGELVARSQVLMKATDTDWTRWNRQPEYAKTAMVFRSEAEAKPSGVVLAELQVGTGRLLVTTLPASYRLQKAQDMIRRVLANLGVPLTSAVVDPQAFDSGKLFRVLKAGPFNNSITLGDSSAHEAIKNNAAIGSSRWTPQEANGNGAFDLGKCRQDCPAESGPVYLSFWIFSPKALDSILPEPNLPEVSLKLRTGPEVEVLLNGTRLLQGAGDLQAQRLLLRLGWNQFLIGVSHAQAGSQFSAELACSSQEFLNQLKSAIEKP